MNQYLVLLLAITTFLTTIAPTWGQERVDSKVTFVCQEQQGVPTTIAKNIDGQLQPLFHWKNEVFAPDVNLQKTCADVSTKLNEYFERGKDPHLFKLVIADEWETYIVCIKEDSNTCSRFLFPLFDPTDRKVDNAIDYKEALTKFNNIIDPKFKDVQLLGSPERMSIEFFVDINLFDNKQ